MNRGAAEIRPDLVGAYRFMVELEGMLVAGFSEVSGFTVETEATEVSEGGLNQYVHRLPTQTKHVPIVLKRGMIKTNDLWKWYADVIAGEISRKSGAIILYNEWGQEFRRWNFYDAYPSKWVGSDLNAVSSDVAVETVELTHNGFKVVK